MIEIEIDGKQLKVEPGSMIIEAADDAGIDIPRFCYHKKLSIAANCRMCLVDVEKSGKPLPACATPVMDGMKIHTTSAKALEAQKSVMEFLLINHPLDCPICDQGGECELQDVAMGYGGDVSRYNEGKRVVKDKAIGSLIETDMTRCIHCTRCVRFGQEIAGLRELGATGRGEHTEIGTFIEHSLQSEVSGNIIDLCPVGALTSKPFRYSARAWELAQQENVSPHDCLHSNLYVHTRRGQVMRVVPRDNEAVNETWLSDRDRFSYEGVNSDQRLLSPLIKRNGTWEVVSWQSALAFVVEKLNHVIKTAGAEQLGGLISPNATVEELYLFQKFLRGLGSNNVDHRLRQVDFSDQEQAPLSPVSSVALTDLEQADVVLTVGSHLRHEQPLAALRVRKAFLAGARVMSIDAVDHDAIVDHHARAVLPPAAIPAWLLGLAKACASANEIDIPTEIASIFDGVVVNEQQQQMAKALKAGERCIIVSGALAQHHPQAALIQSLLALIAQWNQAKRLAFQDGGNAVGAWIAGAIPHRTANGQRVSSQGLTALSQFKQGLQAYFLMGVEPELDSVYPAKAVAALEKAQLVVAMTAFDSEAYRAYADVLLPIAPWTETSGTYININGLWQTVAAAVTPAGHARPAWKILRVLGNLFELPEFEYNATSEIRETLQQHWSQENAGARENWSLSKAEVPAVSEGSLTRINYWPMYKTDAIVRRANGLQKSALSMATATVELNAQTAAKLKLIAGQIARVSQGEASVSLPVILNERVPNDCVLIPSGYSETAGLNAPYGTVKMVGEAA